MDWADFQVGAMAAGSVIGGVAGGVFSGVSGMAGSYVSHIGLVGGMGPPTAGMMTAGGVVGAIAGGAAGGATAGGMSAAYNGENVNQGILAGAATGALGGAVFGGIAGHFGETSGWRIGFSALAGGGMHKAVYIQLADGKNVVVYPTIGVPTSTTLHDATTNSPNCSSAVIFDPVGLHPGWLEHLDWLGSQIRSTHWVKATEVGWQFADWGD